MPGPPVNVGDVSFSMPDEDQAFLPEGIPVAFLGLDEAFWDEADITKGDGGGSGGPSQSGKRPPRVILPPREHKTAQNQSQEILAIAMLLAVYSDCE